MNDPGAHGNSDGTPEKPIRYWRFYPGHRAQAWQYFSDSGIIGMGPRPGSNDQEPDLRTMTASSFEDFRSDLLSVKKWDPQSPHPRRLWHFLHDMAPGDKVVAYGQAQVLGLGEITGEYYYEEDEHGYPHRRSVQWTNTEPRSLRPLASGLQKKLMARTPIVSLASDEYAQIVELMGNQGQRTWIFQAKPEDYDLKQELRRRIGDSWDLRSFSNRAHELQVGDRVLLWRSGDPKTKEVGGVYGTGRVACKAYPLDNGRQGVDLVYQSVLVTPLLRDELKEDSELSAMAIMKQAAGTVFPVTLEQWDRLAPLLGELVPAGSQVQIWWVNQGGSYKQERDECVLFAGLQEGGVVSEARRRLEDMLPGDLVLSYVDKKVVAVSRVQGKWQRRESRAHDGEVGRVAPLEYHEFEEPIPVTNETLTAIREL
ncbi:MAG: EVE domain-containing protein, partial [Acidimicrobiales bacterium]